MSAVDRIRKALKVLGPQEPDTEVPVPVVVALSPGEAEALLRLADAARGIQPIALHSGPAAPTFDEFDRAVERNRGEWVSIDGAAYESLAAALARLDWGQ